MHCSFYFWRGNGGVIWNEKGFCYECMAMRRAEKIMVVQDGRAMKKAEAEERAKKEEEEEEEREEGGGGARGGTHPRTEEDDEETDAELCLICRDFDCQCPPVFVEALEAFRSP